MDIEHKRTFCVAGWGKTGVSVAEMLLRLGKKVKVTEKQAKKHFSSQSIKNFEKRGVEFEFGGHSEKFIADSELVIVSPGIDFLKTKLKDIVLGNCIPYLGELEFASYFTKSKIIAITGTNGKSTTAHLIYLLLNQKNKKVYLGGNIGRPLADFALDTKANDLIVLEVSSFQLETAARFRPNIAVLLNIEPDHIDRHQNFHNYLSAKMKIFQNQEKNDWAVINRRINLPKNSFSSINSQIVYFSDQFNDQNLSAVYRVGQIFNFTKTDCMKIFSKYRKLPHRQQVVKVIDKITFINDSKATNPASTFFALKAIKAPIILIAGGKDKGFNYSHLGNYSRKIKKINTIGEAADKIEDELEDKIKCQKFKSLQEAVLFSYKEATAGDTVLFSPMCSSFDMFKNYKQRGQKYIEIVKDILIKNEKS